MLPEITPKDEQLVSRRRRLESAWNVSPYYIEKPKPKSDEFLIMHYLSRGLFCFSCQILCRVDLPLLGSVADYYNCWLLRNSVLCSGNSSRDRTVLRSLQAEGTNKATSSWIGLEASSRLLSSRAFGPRYLMFIRSLRLLPSGYKVHDISWVCDQWRFSWNCFRL
jgi:hypothetical protein